MTEWSTGELRIGVEIALALFFVVSGLAKLLVGHAAFARAIERYELIPSRLANPLARTLPPVEIAVGVASLIPATAQAATALMALLLVVFSAAIGMNLVRGRIHECGCLGDLSPRRISWKIVLQNGVIAVAALSATWPGSSRVSVVHLLASTDDGWAVAISALAAVLLLLLWNQADATLDAYEQFSDSLSEPIRPPVRSDEALPVPRRMEVSK